jgi:hypothetical protein
MTEHQPNRCCPTCKRPVKDGEPYDTSIRFEIAFCPCGAVLTRSLENRRWRLDPNADYERAFREPLTEAERAEARGIAEAGDFAKIEAMPLDQLRRTCCLLGGCALGDRAMLLHTIKCVWPENKRSQTSGPE